MICQDRCDFRQYSDQRKFLMIFLISIGLPPIICRCLHYTIAVHLREAGIYPAQWSEDGVHDFRAAVTGL